jgi:hypothetical protein
LQGFHSGQKYCHNGARPSPPSTAARRQGSKIIGEGSARSEIPPVEIKPQMEAPWLNLAFHRKAGLVIALAREQSYF